VIRPGEQRTLVIPTSAGLVLVSPIEFKSYNSANSNNSLAEILTPDVTGPHHQTAIICQFSILDGGQSSTGF